MEEPATVFGFLFEEESDEGVRKLVEELEESRFERNRNYSNPVYDWNDSRVIVYPRSGNVRLLQKESSAYIFPESYSVENDFDLISKSIKPEGEGYEWQDL